MITETNTAFASFEELLSNEISEQPFKQASFADIPYVMFSFLKKTSVQLRSFEALYVEAPSDEVATCIKSLKSVITAVTPMLSQLILEMEKKNPDDSMLMLLGEDGDLADQCAERFNKSYEEGLEKFEKADSVIEKAKEVWDWGGSYVDDVKWCVDKLVDKINGKHGED